MKKILSLALSLVLLSGLGLPAMAAEAGTTDARLAAVTQKVKDKLKLDTADYTRFQGDLNEGTVTPTWNLHWSGEAAELYIEATEGGRVLSYNAMEQTNPSNPGEFGPIFPKMTRDQAREIALNWMEKALEEGQRAAIEATDGTGTLSATSYSFSGEILENGLPSPFRFFIHIRTEDSAVTGFHIIGNPEQYMGETPSATPAAESAKAGLALRDTLKLRLEYVLDEDGKTAVLRYLPEYVPEYYVDAQTGKLVNLTELYEQVREDNQYAGGGKESAAAPQDMVRNESLTAAEQEGIAKLEGVLPKEALDAAAKKITALGLSKYTLAGTAYSLDKDSGDVSARLQYARTSGKDVYRRYVTLDAKNGALLSVYSSMPWKENVAANVSASAAQTKAESFLKEICGTEFAKTARYERESAAPYGVKTISDGKNISAYSMQYAQKENGYFFPGNSLSVGVDASDGSISSYYKSFDSAITLQSAEGIVDAPAALTAWFGTYAVKLGYQGVPQKLDLSAPEWRPLIDMGQKYLYALKLTYRLDRAEDCAGIDAKTGTPVKTKESKKTEITYDDLADNWVQAQAQQLAAYGVGWVGGSFLPAKELTQLDLVALLVSTNGYRYDPNEDGAAEQLYNVAYSMGILEKKERNDTALMTRAQLVKLLLDSAGYGNIGGLKDIFKCSFADSESIPAAYYGYAAVAQALGLVKGDRAGNFAPERIATRAEAASMLCNFMSR